MTTGGTQWRRSKEEEAKNEEREEIKRLLCSNVMKGEWYEVVKIYEEHREAEVQGVWITPSGDTALHMAVYENRVRIVRKLVELTDVDMEVMHSVDNKGNTPLHLAAKMGNEKMCYYIASKKKGLIGHRNNDGETPMFLAALHGNKDAFLRLYAICCVQEDIYSMEDTRIYGYCRRSDGRNVLHCAIDEEHFDLAFQIINRLPNFQYYVDERGHTPLHLLASKHSAFKSSCHLTWFQEIIYACIPSKKPTVEKDRPYSLSELISVLGWRWKDTARAAGDVEKASLPKGRSIFSTVMKELLKKAVDLFISGIKDLFPKHIPEMKEKHVHSIEIMNIILQGVSHHDYRDGGSIPPSHPNEIPFLTDEYNRENEETPLLIAAKNGIKEIVTGILKVFPVAIDDVNSEGKNLMHLAVENRQSHIYQFLRQNRRRFLKDLFNSVDDERNNALHIVANFNPYQFWMVPNSVLSMQWEIKWYEYIKESLQKELVAHQNKQGNTPKEIFLKTHNELLKNDKEWVMKTSEQCSIVATLIATVAFATSATVPGGVKGNHGEPVLRQEEMFEFFAISSLVALCSSLTAVAIFLSIVTSRPQVTNFALDVPLKLVYGLTALFVAVISMLISFCGGHFFLIKDIVRGARVIEYVAVFLPATYYVWSLFPLYYAVLLAILTKVPQRVYIPA